MCCTRKKKQVNSDFDLNGQSQMSPPRTPFLRTEMRLAN